MLDKIPNAEEMTALIGQSLYDIWNKLCALIDEKYDMECLWNKGGKAWTYEYKYRRGGKTLCALYARENCVGFMIILGKDEQLKFDTDRNSYSKEVQKIYDETKTYHVGDDDNSRYTNAVAMFSKISFARLHNEISSLQIKVKRDPDRANHDKWNDLYKKLKIMNGLMEVSNE